MEHLGRRLALALAAAGLSLGSAWGAVSYQFAGYIPEDMPGTRVSFELTTPGLVELGRLYGLDELVACSTALLVGDCAGVRFLPGDGALPDAGVVEFRSTRITYFYYFDAQAFAAPGAYASLNPGPFNPTAELTVTLVPIPEPSAAWLMLAGLPGCLAAARWSRRRAVQAP